MDRLSHNDASADTSKTGAGEHAVHYRHLNLQAFSQNKVETAPAEQKGLSNFLPPVLIDILPKAQTEKQSNAKTGADSAIAASDKPKLASVTTSEPQGLTEKLDSIAHATLDQSAKPSFDRTDWSDTNTYDLNDLSAKQWLSLAKYEVGTIHADAANFTAFMVRMNSESIAANVVKSGSNLGRSEVMGLSAIPLAGLTGFALHQDWQSFKSSTDLGEKSFYAVQSAMDATALAGSAMMTIAPFRPAATSVAALSIGARLATGVIHSGVDMFRVIR